MFAMKLSCVGAQIIGAVENCVLMLIPGTTAGNTVMVMGIALATAGNGHTAFDVIWKPITSPLSGLLTVKLVPVTPPCTDPLRVHTKPGAVPPPVTVAVKVTGTPGHTVVGPVAAMDAVVGVSGLTTTGNEMIADCPQTFCPRTVMVPLPPIVAAVAEMLCVVEPPLHPEGNDQTYPVAFALPAVLYTFVVPAHTGVGPLMPEGASGNGVTVTASVRAMDVPQALVAVTEMVPDVAPGVAMMVLLVLLPVHPEGNTQL